MTQYFPKNGIDATPVLPQIPEAKLEDIPVGASSLIKKSPQFRPQIRTLNLIIPNRSQVNQVTYDPRHN
ncbi:hypothetical protein ABNE29_15725 [Paenibacillus larvae]